MKKVFVIVMFTAFLSLPMSAHAKHGKGIVWNTPESSAKQVTRNVMQRLFSETEKAVIGEYFSPKVSDKKGKGKSKKARKGGKGKKHKGLPQGLAKKDQLPHGLAKQLEKNGRLPPGLAKRDLPDDLLKRLPICGKKGKCVIAGDDVLLVEKGTELILDIIRGAVKN